MSSNRRDGPDKAVPLGWINYPVTPTRAHQARSAPFQRPPHVWPARVPLAVTPWHCVHVVEALNPLWSTVADDQLAVLLWQLSQLPVTPLCVAVAGLPTALRKLPPAAVVWQLTHPVLGLKFA